MCLLFSFIFCFPFFTFFFFFVFFFFFQAEDGIRDWSVTGVPDVCSSDLVLIAQQRRQREAPATPRGWDVGQLAAAEFDDRGLAEFSYYVRVPAPGLRYSVKVALAWQSKVDRKSVV